MSNKTEEIDNTTVVNEETPNTVAEDTKDENKSDSFNEEIIYEDDSEMPEPETKDYRQRLKVTPKFMELFYMCTGNMKYATSLTNNQGSTIKLLDLVEYVESTQNNMPVEEMNIVLSFLGSAEFKYVRPIMALIEKGKQHELWTLIDNNEDTTN